MRIHWGMRPAASLLAVAVLAFASASAAHGHTSLADGGEAARIDHHADSAPVPDASPAQGHGCLSCNTAKPSTAVAHAAAAPAPALRAGPRRCRELPVVAGVSLYRSGPERAPPASA
jgi:hypothetical protein